MIELILNEKRIQKPENWQDFETLCKKLWGEIWKIPMEVKRNGRNGQPQAGVDVYGVPKNENDYWGIQCKGKDDYTEAKLSRAEIDQEVEKAKTFLPKLAVFIFATTMNKNASIEEYIRLKDLESRANNGFKILIYCWEDIADLIDDNQDTYNFWVANKLHRTSFDFAVHLNGFQQEFIVYPKYVRTIKRYIVKDYSFGQTNLTLATALMGNLPWLSSVQNATGITVTPKRVDKSICSFEIIMENIGSQVIEDWLVEFEVIGEHRKIMDQLGTSPLGMIDVTFLKLKRTHIDGNRFSFYPKDNEPLIQKVNRFFEMYIIPEYREYTIPIRWQLLARDFNTTGILHLIVEPQYEDKFVYEFVDAHVDLKEDEVIFVETNDNDEEN